MWCSLKNLVLDSCTSKVVINANPWGHFLWQWNMMTWLPEDWKEDIPYQYQDGDWFIIGQACVPMSYPDSYQRRKDFLGWDYHIPKYEETKGIWNYVKTIWAPVTTNYFDLLERFLMMPILDHKKFPNDVTESHIDKIVPYHTSTAIWYKSITNMPRCAHWYDGEKTRSISRWYECLKKDKYEVPSENSDMVQICDAMFIRAVADRPVKPDSTDPNRSCLIQNWNGSIWHNASEGIISIVPYWTDPVTIKDKNEWATDVFDYTLNDYSTQYIWNVYQWWEQNPLDRYYDYSSDVTTWKYDDCIDIYQDVLHANQWNGEPLIYSYWNVGHSVDDRLTTWDKEDACINYIPEWSEYTWEISTLIDTFNLWPGDVIYYNWETFEWIWLSDPIHVCTNRYDRDQDWKFDLGNGMYIKEPSDQQLLTIVDSPDCTKCFKREVKSLVIYNPNSWAAEFEIWVYDEDHDWSARYKALWQITLPPYWTWSMQWDNNIENLIVDTAHKHYCLMVPEGENWTWYVDIVASRYVYRDWKRVDINNTVVSLNWSENNIQCFLENKGADKCEKVELTSLNLFYNCKNSWDTAHFYLVELQEEWYPEGVILKEFNLSCDETATLTCCCSD